MIYPNGIVIKAIDISTMGKTISNRKEFGDSSGEQNGLKERSMVCCVIVVMFMFIFSVRCEGEYV